jgi:hypothetical protein
MAVYQTGGGGLLSSLLKGAGMASMFVPGMQGAAPWLMGANALASGDVGGAIGMAAAPMLWKEAGGIFGKAAAPAAANAPLGDALTAAHRQNFQPPDTGDYVDMRLDGMKAQAQKPVNDALDVAAYTPRAQQPQMNESLLNALMRYRRY